MNPTLCNWVHKQRTKYNKGTLVEERIKLLEGLGFEWQVVIVTKSMTDCWIERGIELSSAEVDELQNAKGIKRIRAFFNPSSLTLKLATASHATFAMASLQ
jgi:hypothetical protein